MNSTKKGNIWHFGTCTLLGMKANITVDAHSGLIHIVGVTTAKTNDGKKLASFSANQIELFLATRDTSMKNSKRLPEMQMFIEMYGTRKAKKYFLQPRKRAAKSMPWFELKLSMFLEH